MADLLDENFKTTVLKMLRKLKEDVEKAKSTMCEKNGNISKEMENLKNRKEILEQKSTINEI